jgi:hypothetical protein
MSDMSIESPCKRGDKGKKVRLIQEWLSLQGYRLVIDGDFGPATEAAVRAFQGREQLQPTGVVTPSTFEELVAPMRAAMQPIASNGEPLGDLVLEYATQHLKAHPREIGGENCGPWVRLYMKGNEGPAWPWCAGFVCYCLDQACTSLGISMPITASVSCDWLAASAKERGLFLSESAVADRTAIPPGSVFLNRRTPTDWVHTGIVVKAERDFFTTIEGNTNDEGSREGFEVCARVRGYEKKDFIPMFTQA